MRIDLSNFPAQFNSGCQYAYAQVRQWLDYTVSLIHKASPYLQDSFRAGVVLVALNIAFFEITSLICYLINRILNHFVPYEGLPISERNVRALALGGVFVATIAVANCACCRMLRLPLSYWKVAVVSISTNFLYLFLRTR